MLSRRWQRQLIKFAISMMLFGAVLLITDHFYNFLPASVHSRLPLHESSSVVTDIKVVTCWTLAGCAAEEKDGWVQIPKDLHLNALWAGHAFVMIQRRPDTEVAGQEVVLDIVTRKEDMDDEKGWRQVGDLWVRYGTFRNVHDAVTELDVLFGTDSVEPRKAWSLRNGHLLENNFKPRLTIKHGNSTSMEVPKLKVPSSGRFKILQVADLHFSTGVGKCMDPLPYYAAGCEADPRTLEFYEMLLDTEKPDFVVLSGDQIFGQGSPDSVTSMLKVVAPLIERKIPYAQILGNHDDEGSMNREEIMNFIESLPYSLTQRGPTNIDGVGNYHLQVEAEKSDNPAISMYFLDTHKRLPNQKKTPGYDHIKQNQLDWVEAEHAKLKLSIDKYPLAHVSMAFIHIPLPEYISPGNLYYGKFREGSTAPRFNSGARDVFARVGISLVNAGHDHCNDFCVLDDKTGEDKGKIWLCHAGAIGEGGYAGYDDFVRRARVFEIETQSGIVTSWKIKNEDDFRPFDFQELVRAGEALKPEN